MPSRPEPFGRAGPWAAEAAAIESAHGPARTIHVSLGEFARTLPAREEVRERYREGGVPARAIRSATRGPGFAREVEQYRTLYARFRAFDRPNVLHLFPTFVPRHAFARDYPAAVETGPLWPDRYRRTGPSGRTGADWFWYASPVSARRIVPAVARALHSVRPSATLTVVMAAPPPDGDRPANVRYLAAGAQPERRWRAWFERSEMRIVTGSRTLLEALELGRPFLYFNGILGEGRRKRRHRPEKIESLLAAWKREGVDPRRQNDLRLFSGGRSVEAVVTRAARRAGPWRRRRWSPPTPRFPLPYADAGAVLVAVARALAASPTSAEAIVQAVRERRPPPWP